MIIFTGSDSDAMRNIKKKNLIDSGMTWKQKISEFLNND